MRRGGWSEGETARRVGVEELLRPPGMLVLRVSREGRREEEAGEWAREEAIERRGEDSVDMVSSCSVYIL